MTMSSTFWTCAATPPAESKLYFIRRALLSADAQLHACRSTGIRLPAAGCLHWGFWQTRYPCLQHTPSKFVAEVLLICRVEFD